MLRKRCSWCRTVLDGKGPIRPEETISDGICGPCAEKLWADANGRAYGRPACQRSGGL